MAAPTPETFTPGDVVYLKSGGPAMTVDVIQGTMACVTWFAGMTLATSWIPVANLSHTQPK